MESIKTEKVSEFLEILKKLPPPKSINIGDEPEGKMRCCNCGKLMDISEATLRKSPYNYERGNTVVDPICKSCASQVKDFAYIVCPKTQRVIARMEPHTDVSGFEFEKNGVYHVDISPAYLSKESPDFLLENKSGSGVVMTSVIIEKKLYDEEHKRIIIT